MNMSDLSSSKCDGNFWKFNDMKKLTEMIFRQYGIDKLHLTSAYTIKLAAHAHMTDGVRAELGLGPQRAQRTNDANIRESSKNKHDLALPHLLRAARRMSHSAQTLIFELRQSLGAQQAIHPVLVRF